MSEPHDDTKRTVADAMEDFQDGALDEERLESVRRLLLSDAEARRYYLQINAMNHDLAMRDVLSGTTGEAVLRQSAPPMNSFQKLSWKSLAGRFALAAAVAALVMAVVWPVMHDVPAADRPIAFLEQTNGDVTIADAAARMRTAQSGAEIYTGDIVRTRGTLGAVLGYADGSRLSLVGDTSLTLSGVAQKRIVLHSGTLFASVAPQVSGRPMLVATPQDQVQVLGTRFSLDATTVETDLRVNEGRVRLTRQKDGRTVDVPAGRRVVSSAASPLVVEAIPQTPDQWSEDFESGLPQDWKTGQFVAGDLPAGAKGGVRAVRDVAAAEGTVAIATPAEWTRGLFAVHEETHLHFTLAMEDPGWFNILILTRSANGDPPTFAGNYIFDRPVWFGQPGQWGTVTIPLSRFRPLPPSRGAFKGAVPFQLLFSSPDKDRGLTIDRIWITRGGPRKIESKFLNETRGRE